MPDCLALLNSTKMCPSMMLHNDSTHGICVTGNISNLSYTNGFFPGNCNISKAKIVFASSSFLQSKGMPITASEIRFDLGQVFNLIHFAEARKRNFCSVSKLTLIQPLSTTWDSNVQNTCSLFLMLM